MNRIEKEFEIKIITPYFFLSVWNGDRQTFIRGRLSNENNFEQKLLPLTLSQRNHFKSYEIIIVVINEIIKRPVYNAWAKKIGTARKKNYV